MSYWWNHEAEWWQFWYPSSGHIGGGLMGLVLITLIILVMLMTGPSRAFGPVPKPDQCISVNALLNRNCAPVYMCNDDPKAGTNADWCCSTTLRWKTEEQKLMRWYKRNCGK